VKIVAVIQARAKSARFPNKAIVDIDGHPCIWRIYQRLQHTCADQVVVATPFKDVNTFLPVCSRYGMQNFVGPEKDLLTRILHTAYSYTADAVVLVGADCPLICPTLVCSLIESFMETEGRVEFGSNCIIRTFPNGQDVEMFTTALLTSLSLRMNKAKDREYFAYWCRKKLSKRRKISVELEEDLSWERWTMDYPEDHAFVEAIYKEMDQPVFGIKEIQAVLQEKPELRKLNESRKGLGFGDPEDSL